VGDFETPVKALLNFFTSSYLGIFRSAALCVAKATGAGKAEKRKSNSNQRLKFLFFALYSLLVAAFSFGNFLYYCISCLLLLLALLFVLLQCQLIEKSAARQRLSKFSQAPSLGPCSCAFLCQRVYFII